MGSPGMATGKRYRGETGKKPSPLQLPNPNNGRSSIRDYCASRFWTACGCCQKHPERRFVTAQDFTGRPVGTWSAGGVHVPCIRRDAIRQAHGWQGPHQLSSASTLWTGWKSLPRGGRLFRRAKRCGGCLWSRSFSRERKTASGF